MEKTKVVVDVKNVYTILGVKKKYLLKDMSYGDRLIFVNNQPTYYLNIFDDIYKEINFEHDSSLQTFLQKKFASKNPQLSLKQSFFGLVSHVSNETFLELEKLPRSVVE